MLPSQFYIWKFWVANIFFCCIYLSYFGILLAAAEEIQELWVEYENNASLEANLVKDFDKVCYMMAFICVCMLSHTHTPQQ